jgi:hypothetical protein
MIIKTLIAPSRRGGGGGSFGRRSFLKRPNSAISPQLGSLDVILKHFPGLFADINAFYHEASSRGLGRQVRAPRGALQPRSRRDRRCARVAARRALPPGRPREPKRGSGKQLGQGTLNKGWARITLNPPTVYLLRRAFQQEYVLFLYQPFCS